MEITLTKEQYKTLIEMVYLGEWMINATRTKAIKKYAEMEQHIASFAKAAGVEDAAAFDPELKQYFPTKAFEESIDEFIAEYDNETFWEDLTARLAQRDMERRFGDKLEKMTWEEDFKPRFKIEDGYNKEFAGHGLERLEIVPTAGEP